MQCSAKPSPPRASATRRTPSTWHGAPSGWKRSTERKFEAWRGLAIPSALTTYVRRDYVPRAAGRASVIDAAAWSAFPAMIAVSEAMTAISAVASAEAVITDYRGSGAGAGPLDQDDVVVVSVWLTTTR